MPRLTSGDADLHYPDGTHRWVAPIGINQDVWNAAVRTHLELHRASMGGVPTTEQRASLEREAEEQRRINKARRGPKAKKPPPSPGPET